MTVLLLDKCVILKRVTWCENAGKTVTYHNTHIIVIFILFRKILKYGKQS